MAATDTTMQDDRKPRARAAHLGLIARAVLVMLGLAARPGLAADLPADPTRAVVQAVTPAACQHLLETPTPVAATAGDAIRPLLGRGQTPPWCARTDFGWGAVMWAERDGQVVVAGPGGAVARPAEGGWRFLNRALATDRMRRFHAPQTPLWSQLPLLELGRGRAGALLVPEELGSDQQAARQGWALATAADAGGGAVRLSLPGRAKSAASAAAALALVDLGGQPYLLTREPLFQLGVDLHPEIADAWELRHPADRRRADSEAARVWFAARVAEVPDKKRDKTEQYEVGTAADCAQALMDVLPYANYARRAGYTPPATRKAIDARLQRAGRGGCRKCPAAADERADTALGALATACPKLQKTLQCMESTPDVGPAAWSRCEPLLK